MRSLASGRTSSRSTPTTSRNREPPAARPREVCALSRHAVTLIPGDGVGPEIADATVRVLEATGVDFDWDVQQAGENVMATYGTPLPDHVLDSIRRNKVALKGPITTPIGTGFRSVNVGLRQALNLYACVRPVKAYAGARNLRDDIDLVFIRENSEDLYAGIEFEEGTPDCLALIEEISARAEKPIKRDSGLSIKPLSISGSRRIVQYAFDYARLYGRKKVTLVHKANIMKFTDGLYLRVGREVAAENPDIEFDDRIVDNICMQLVLRPQEYDVLCLPNLYGDIVSDLGAGLIGGLGLAPGANIGTEAAVFEATHGSAPKYTGQNKVNPMAVMLSGVLMLRHFDEAGAADALEGAIADVLREGKSLTYDLKPRRDDPTAVGTSQVADAIVERIRAGA
ncbi:MAG: isocitrate/isopropylmalate dehydrogenase family protein [Candidatus Dormibacteraeota bacterium]|nr:isocitrate/isopropylmalate dehydrogenase family protein [Candidatus Dormibacteraeota bacterium]